MQIDFSTVLIDVRDNTPLTQDRPAKGRFLKNPDGVELRDAAGRRIPEINEVAITLQHVAGESLSGVLPEDQGDSAETKLRRGKLIEKIFTNPQCDLTLDEAHQIKERIGKCYGPLVVVAADKILEKKNEEKVVLKEVGRAASEAH